MTEFLQTLTLSGLGHMQAISTPTDNINTIPAPDAGITVSFTWTPVDGNVSYIINGVTYNPTNAKYTPTHTPITFVGSVTMPAGVQAVEFRWDFGDGVIGYGQTVAHTYKVANLHTQAILCVTDSRGMMFYSRAPLYLRTFNFVSLTNGISVLTT